MSGKKGPSKIVYDQAELTVVRAPFTIFTYADRQDFDRATPDDFFVCMEADGTEQFMAMAMAGRPGKLRVVPQWALAKIYAPGKIFAPAGTGVPLTYERAERHLNRYVNSQNNQFTCIYPDRLFLKWCKTGLDQDDLDDADPKRVASSYAKIFAGPSSPHPPAASKAAGKRKRPAKTAASVPAAPEEGQEQDGDDGGGQDQGGAEVEEVPRPVQKSFKEREAEFRAKVREGPKMKKAVGLLESKYGYLNTLLTFEMDPGDGGAGSAVPLYDDWNVDQMFPVPLHTLTRLDVASLPRTEGDDDESGADGGSGDSSASSPQRRPDHVHQALAKIGNRALVPQLGKLGLTVPQRKRSRTIALICHREVDDSLQKLHRARDYIVRRMAEKVAQFRAAHDKRQASVAHKRKQPSDGSDGDVSLGPPPPLPPASPAPAAAQKTSRAVRGKPSNNQIPTADGDAGDRVPDSDGWYDMGDKKKKKKKKTNMAAAAAEKQRVSEAEAETTSAVQDRTPTGAGVKRKRKRAAPVEEEQEEEEEEEEEEEDKGAEKEPDKRASRSKGGKRKRHSSSANEEEGGRASSSALHSSGSGTYSDESKEHGLMQLLEFVDRRARQLATSGASGDEGAAGADRRGPTKTVNDLFEDTQLLRRIYGDDDGDAGSGGKRTHESMREKFAEIMQDGTRAFYTTQLLMPFYRVAKAWLKNSLEHKKLRHRVNMLGRVAQIETAGLKNPYEKELCAFSKQI